MGESARRDPTHLGSTARGAAEPRDSKSNGSVRSAFALRLNPSARKRVFAAVLIPLVAMLIAVASFAVLTQETTREEQLVTHTRQVREDIRHTTLLLVDAETGVRGYLITRQSDYLAPYEAARGTLPPTLDQLAAAVQGNPTQVERVREIQPLVQQELQDFETLRGAPVGRADLTILARTKSRMDDLRQRLDLMNAEELRLLNQRTTEVDQLRLATSLAIGASLALGLLGAILASRLFRRLLAEEAAARAEAEASARLRDEFLSVAAHELKNPMTSLWGTAQLELRRAEREQSLDLDRTRSGLRLIADQSRKLVRLVEQLLDVSRLRGGKLVLAPEETNLAALVAGVAEAARLRGGRHEVIVRAPSAVVARVDPLRLEQVLTNLIDNAMKFSPEAEPVEIELSQPTPGETRIAVTDHGIGIPPERRAHIFEVYYQAHATSQYRGLGLGLYVSRQIVELHHGTIAAEFPPEGGTRFVVGLPTQEPA